CFRSKAEIFAFIEVNRAEHDLTLMCRVYGVTRAGFYAWRARERSERERQNEALACEIRAVHAESRGIYGSPRVHQALRSRGRQTGRGLVFHTDRGTEYAAGAFKERLAELGFTQSMNRPGKVTDNAFIESFFHSMKAEVFHGYRFNEDREVCSVLKDYLPFYN